MHVSISLLTHPVSHGTDLWASEAQYKKIFKKWGFVKNIKAAEKQAILGKRKEHEEEQDEAPEQYCVRGLLVDIKEIQRRMRRPGAKRHKAVGVSRNNDSPTASRRIQTQSQPEGNIEDIDLTITTDYLDSYGAVEDLQRPSYLDLQDVSLGEAWRVIQSQAIATSYDNLKHPNFTKIHLPFYPRPVNFHPMELKNLSYEMYVSAAFRMFRNIGLTFFFPDYAFQFPKARECVPSGVDRGDHVW